MFKVNSQRAKTILESPRFFKKTPTPDMKKFPSEILKVWVKVELEQNNVKNLSFSGEVSDGSLLVIESMANLVLGKNISRFSELSIRECEAFLRNRNSEVAFEGLSESEETELKKFFNWMKNPPRVQEAEDYHFSSQKGPFQLLKLTEKVRELKAFLNSTEVQALYVGRIPPELVDVEDLTVFLQAPYQDEADRILFDRLHELGVETFGEESLNFIPDA